MDSSIVLAKIIGTTFIVVGLSLFNKKTLKAIIDESTKNRGFLWLSGLIAFIMGVVMISIYNVWAYQPKVIITIFGWTAILKGILIMVFPEYSINMYKKLLGSMLFSFSATIAILMGIVMWYISFAL